jgi:hypothetical protein
VHLYWQTYEAEFVQKLLQDNNKKLAVPFNHTFRYTYINVVLTINNHNIHFIYPDELEIKDTTESGKSALYLDILLTLCNIDFSGRLTTTLYDKRDDSSTFLFYVVIYHFHFNQHAYGVYISELIRYARAWFAYEYFSKRGKLMTKKLMLQGYNESCLE